MSKNLNKYFDIGKRLKELRGSLSQTEMAKQFNLTLRSYHRYESGERVPNGPVLNTIAQKYNKTVDWILTGKEEEKVIYNKGDISGDQLNDAFAYIPQVTGKISAGAGRVPENTVEMKVAFRKDWIRRKGDPKNMVLIRVAGDSMEPTLLSGDLVLIDRGRNYIEPQGGIYAIALDDIIMIKRIQILEDKVRIISDNVRYEPVEMSTDRMKVNGRVIWFARELER